MMTADPEIVRAITVVAVALIVCLCLVAILAPAALAAFLRPLLQTVERLVDVITKREKPP